mgnify:CR=1 FL=1
MSKTMEEFIKENGTYDEKEGSYSFACSEADVKKRRCCFATWSIWDKSHYDRERFWN